MAGELSTDEYQRSRFVADLIERLRGAAGPLDLLDVGGSAGLLQPFLPEDRVVTLDADAGADVDAGTIQGNVCRLPFRDASFDAVVACDTLQHVPYEQREEFLRECRRVTRSWVLVVGPYRSARVEQAEGCLRSFQSEKLGLATPELDSHARHGLPSQSFVEARLREQGGRVASVGHGNLERWLATSCLSSYLGRDRELRSVARELHRFYGEFLYARDLGEPSYRHAVVAAFEGAPLIDPEDFARDLAARDPGTEAGLHLARELIDFDVSRDVVQAEFERLRAQNRELELEVQRAREEQVDAGAQEAAHRIAELEAELGRLTESLELERAEREETRRAFGVELDEERRQRAELERKGGSEDAQARALFEQALTEERQRVERLAQHAEELELELERQHARAERDRVAYHENVSSMELDLVSFRQLVADTSQQVAHQEEQLAKSRNALQAAEVELDSLRRGGTRADELQRELREAVSLAESLQMELGGRDHDLLRRQAQLEASLIEADRLSRQLESERTTTEDLRRELGRRFANLRRAFARRPGDDGYED